jgi:hypothetical protein
LSRQEINDLTEEVEGGRLENNWMQSARTPAAASRHMVHRYIAVEGQVEARFNEQLAASLDDANFIVDGEGEFNSLYLQDIDDDLHSGI